MASSLACASIAAEAGHAFGRIGGKAYPWGLAVVSDINAVRNLPPDVVVEIAFEFGLKRGPVVGFALLAFNEHRR